MNVYEIVVPGPFHRGQVRADCRTGLRMPSDAAIRGAIEREWRRKRRRAQRDGVPLYSGRLFRVCGYALDHAGGLYLKLGDTSYKEYAGTRVPGFFQGRPREALANPLAVCAAIVTSDSSVVIARRRNVDVAAGQYHVVGGFVERGKDGDPFAAMAREIHEELGLTIAPDSLLCLGLIYDCLHPHYELCFSARIDLAFAELARLRPAEVEMSALERIADSPEALRAFLTAQHGVMSPTGEGCLELHVRLGWAPSADWPDPSGPPDGRP